MEETCTPCPPLPELKAIPNSSIELAMTAQIVLLNDITRFTDFKAKEREAKLFMSSSETMINPENLETCQRPHSTWTFGHSFTLEPMGRQVYGISARTFHFRWFCLPVLSKNITMILFPILCTNRNKTGTILIIY